MDDHTLRVLEFDKVLGLLAHEARFSVSRELAGEVRPETGLDDVRRLQAATAEMTALDRMGLDLTTAGASDIRPLLDAAAVGRALEPAELTDVAQTLQSAFRSRQLIERLFERLPVLHEMSAGIADFRPEVREVEEAITSRGEIADSASPTLATTRRELRLARERLEQRARSALADAVRRGIAQEGLLTERSGRTVIPLKAGYRGQMPGIVHDVSSTGATIFVEPMGVVDAGNEVRELELAEQREVRRILARLTMLFGDRADEARESVLGLAELDLVAAKVRLGKRLGCHLPTADNGGSWLRGDGMTVIDRGRHPLLAGDVVPVTVDIGGEFPGLLVTGPNTGGKTVALKTVGLLSLMAQAGLPVPCEESSRFVVLKRIDADIGDEQSIEQSLSTFSSHMRNIRGILANAGPGTLVLLDELGAGTDPTEGAALSRAILEALLDRGAWVMATTHHGELKAFAHDDPRVRNASVEFNLATLSPTYHLTIGLPGQSNAIAIARRLGMEEPILDRAAEGISAGHVELEELLNEIRKERAAAAEAHAREELARRETEEIRQGVTRAREAIDRERVEILDEARRDAERLVGIARRELDRIERRQEAFDPRAAAERLQELDAELAEAAKAAKPKRQVSLPAASVAADIQPGDRIRVRDIDQEGEALTDVGEDGRVEVQFGGLRMKVSVDRVVQSGDREGAGVRQPAAPVRTGPPVSVEIDLRGERAQDAVERCERYLDDAFRAGLPYVRIIHGKGTGALRAAIRDLVRHHPLVTSYEAAPPNQGGDGATLATLAGS